MRNYETNTSIFSEASISSHLQSIMPNSAAGFVPQTSASLNFSRRYIFLFFDIKIN